MEYTCIYEALPNSLVSLPFILLCVLEFCVAIYGIINWKTNAVSGKICICLVFILLIMFISVTIYNYFDSDTIWETYQNGDCLVAEGIIEDYKVGNEGRPDRFTVNGVDFAVSNSSATGYGYTMRQDSGGVLRNGQYCKIFYVPYKYENVIMKILLVQESD